MRRRIIPAVLVCAALGASAAPAMAFTTQTQPPGPPTASGGPGAVVFHCMSIDGTTSVTVLNGAGGVSGGGDCTLIP
jgi:hypothetical protein